LEEMQQNEDGWQFTVPKPNPKAENGCLTDDKDETPSSAYLLCFYDD